MDNELYHFGVLGMKWGRRKANSESSKSSSKKSKKRVKLNEISSEELEKKVKRMNLEKRYNDLLKDKKKVSEGKKLCQEMLSKSIKEAVQPELDARIKQLVTKFGYGNYLREFGPFP